MLLAYVTVAGAWIGEACGWIAAVADGLPKSSTGVDVITTVVMAIMTGDREATEIARSACAATATTIVITCAGSIWAAVAVPIL